MAVNRTADAHLKLALVSCGVAIAALGVVAAHQLGTVDHLPDPPVEFFASDRITGSKMAHPFGIPDSLPGIASYATTLALLLTVRRSRIARRLLALKLTADAGAAGFNAVRQVAAFGKVCSWCTLTAFATAPMVHYGRKALHDLDV